MRRSGHVPGRGAVSSPGPRYCTSAQPIDDGWPGLEPEPERIATEVRSERARSILSSNDSPDLPFSASINPYRGCEHGCIYCYARPTHAYLDLSPGLDFETRLVAKDNAPDVLADSLRSKRYRASPITIGANTDPYQPVERQRRITRGVLEVLLDHQHPLSIITKSTLILRDLDILEELAKSSLVHVLVSITTLDAKLMRIMEPRAASPAARLDAVRRLSKAGVPTGVMAAPIIPAINDHEIEQLVAAAARAGARTCAYVLLRLPREVSELFTAWLEQHFPDRRDRVLGLVRDARSGQLNDSEFGSRMRGRGPYAELLARRFEVARRRHGLDKRMPELSCERFELPPRRGDQLALF